jgi:hypothetical protein
MRERLDEHSRFLELQLAGLESRVKEKGELDIVVPTAADAGVATYRTPSPVASSSNLKDSDKA